jgi:PadR family transcriptional regulator PadR
MTCLIVSIDTIRLMAGIERVTRQLLDLLTVLLEAHLRDEELHGYGLMKRTGLSGPSTYRGLDRLEDARLVDARWEDLPPGDDRPRRCYYRLNPSGVEVARKLLTERRPDVVARLGQVPSRLAPVPRSGLSTLFRGLAFLAGTAR